MVAGSIIAEYTRSLKKSNTLNGRYHTTVLCAILAQGKPLSHKLQLLRDLKHEAGAQKGKHTWSRMEPAIQLLEPVIGAQAAEVLAARKAETERRVQPHSYSEAAHPPEGATVGVGVAAIVAASVATGVVAGTVGAGAGTGVVGTGVGAVVGVAGVVGTGVVAAGVGAGVVGIGVEGAGLGAEGVAVGAGEGEVRRGMKAETGAGAVGWAVGGKDPLQTGPAMLGWHTTLQVWTEMVSNTVLSRTKPLLQR